MNAALTPAELDTLGQVAIRAVRSSVIEHRRWQPDPTECTQPLRAPGAAFVTLRRDGRLRGCIGSLEATQPLVVCVADRARAAALDDPRFAPVTPDELIDIEVEVSVLSEPESMDVHSYDELLRTVQPGVDGLIVELGSRRATLLPSVWDDLPDPDGFIAALWRKAGLQPRAWTRDTRVRRYRAQHWPE